MKRLIVSLLLGTSMAAALMAQTKVMSYNVRNGIGDDNVRDLKRTIKVIKKQKPDFVAIQELDSMAGRTGRTYVLGDLAKGTGMVATYAPAIDYDGGKYGIGLLSRRAPLSVKRYALPDREEGRVILVAEFDSIVVAVTHLSLNPTDALTSAYIINELAAKSSKPMVLCGDLNSHPDSDVLCTLGTRFTVLTDTSRPTYPATTPTETLDYIMSTVPYTATDVRVVEAPVESDHRPVIVTLPVRSK